MCNNNNRNIFNNNYNNIRVDTNIDNKILNYNYSKGNNKISTSSINNPHPSNNRVINLSSFSFPPSIFKVLGKGLNFALAPRKIPVDDIICDIEFGIRGLPDRIKDTIRQDCAVVLRKAKPPKSNLSKEESFSLRSLNQNKDIIVLKQTRVVLSSSWTGLITAARC